MTKEEEQSRREVAAVLEKARSFMEISTRTDYFTGYSLSETIEQRLKLIGEWKDVADGASTEDQKKMKQLMKKTLLGRLKLLEIDTLAAIERAREFE